MNPGGREDNGVLGEVGECRFGREEERGHAHNVCGPDHGLNVEGWPAVGSHADELFSVSFSSPYPDGK